MKHLTEEERLAASEGHPSPEAREHLRTCAECAEQVEAWRQSIRSLEELEWPARVPQRAATFAPIFKWALAACLALCAGFGAGRFSGPDAAKIEAAVKVEVTRELREEMQAMLAQQAKAVEAAQLENQQKLLVKLGEIKDQQTANYLTLRGDLEVLATTADARLQLARRQIMELASAHNGIQ